MEIRSIYFGTILIYELTLLLLEAKNLSCFEYDGYQFIPWILTVLGILPFVNIYLACSNIGLLFMNREQYIKIMLEDDDSNT